MSETANICNCERCGKRCRVATETEKDSTLFRRATEPKGLCANCAITSFVKTGPLREVTGGAWSAPGFEIGAALRLPHVQKQFYAVFAAAKCPVAGEEVEWEDVIANWELPIPPGWDWRGQIYLAPGRGTSK